MYLLLVDVSYEEKRLFRTVQYSIMKINSFIVNSYTFFMSQLTMYWYL
jgi:hypothetical protein